MIRDLQGPPMAMSLCKAMAPLVAADAISKTKGQSPYGQFAMLSPTSTRIEIGKESAIARWYCSAS